MTTRFIKIISATVILLFTAFTARAQLGYNFEKLDIGVAAIGNAVYGDTEKITYTPGGALNFTYSPRSPFVNYVFDLQAGKLAGGDSVVYLSGRQFKSNYIAFAGRVQVQAGEFIDYSNSAVANFCKNIYLSAGVGVVRSNITQIARVSHTDPPYVSPGKNKSTEVFIPTRIGYELKLFNAYDVPTVKIDLGYQVNFMMAENLDGFDAGSKKDVWGQVYLGVKFSIGGNTSYRKHITF